LALLTLLDRTPATAAQIMKVSVSFGEDPFRNERRVRERMQALGKIGIVRAFSLSIAGGGAANYYKLTPEGFRIVHGSDTPLPHRSFFASLPPARLLHTQELADLIVHTLVCAHMHRVQVSSFHRENELLLETGTHRVAPDCHVQFSAGGRTFNVLFELDRSTESLDSHAANSIRTKLLAYEAYQDYVWGLWKSGGSHGLRPYFRVAFLTKTVERAHHILALARQTARNPDRHLCYALTSEGFLTEPDAVRAPIFLDHHGRWQALVNLYPSAHFTRSPVRIAPYVQLALGV
jgi:hypothetical protein